MLSIANKEKTGRNQRTFSLPTGAIGKKSYDLGNYYKSTIHIFQRVFQFFPLPELYVVIKLLENSLTADCDGLKYISLQCLTSGFPQGHVHTNLNQNDALFVPKTHYKLRILYFRGVFSSTLKLKKDMP